jgi:hypothetical protein
VALGAWYGQFVWYWSHALLWSLACCSLLVPLLDWLLPGPRYAWPQADRRGLRSLSRRERGKRGHGRPYYSGYNSQPRRPVCRTLNR